MDYLQKTTFCEALKQLVIDIYWTDMNFKVDYRTFEIIRATDVDRDGIGIELWDRDKNKLIFEIFRHDDTKKLIFLSDKSEIPLQVVDRFLKDFEDQIGREFQEEKWEE